MQPSSIGQSATSFPLPLKSNPTHAIALPTPFKDKESAINLTTSASSQSPISPSKGQPSLSSLNPRSCTTCRKRKVRCDKRHPCSNCQKARIECIFPGPGRAPRRSKKPPDTELLARLRRLEGVVQSLGKGINGEELAAGEEESVKNPEDRIRKQINGVEGEKPGLGVDKGEKKESTSPTRLTRDKKCAKGSHNGTTGLEKDFGRLVVEQGRSRYVSNSFWTSLTEEVAEMQDILDDPSDDEADYPSPESGSSVSAAHEGFIFGFSSAILSLRQLHPPPSQIPGYWDVYKERVDPLIRLFHRSVTEKLIFDAIQNLDQASKSVEAFMFAMYFAVVTSLAPAECQSMLFEEKDVLLKKYRFGVEQALARAGFLATQELLVLQAFTLFLVCARRHDDSRFVWTVSGLLVRIAQSMGVHRDGEQFGLSPFETEMRRRVWWQIITLDIRASEDHGTDPTITEQTFDTKLPLNINDADITPDTVVTPTEHQGCTEMTFDLIRYEVSTTVRRLTYVPPGKSPCRFKSLNASVEDKERLIEKLRTHLEDRYLKYCDMSVPLYWVTATVARLILAKMWLIVHHPFRRDDGGAGLPQEIRDKLFLTSIEILEYTELLEHEQTTVKWGWLFHSYIQYHSIAYMLSELCTRTEGEEVDRAWKALSKTFEQEGGLVPPNKKGMLWKPLRKLMVKARAARAKALQSSTRFPKDGSLGPLPSPARTPLEFLQTADEKCNIVGLDLSPTSKNVLLRENSNYVEPQPSPMGVEQSLYDTAGMSQWMINNPTIFQDPMQDTMQTQLTEPLQDPLNDDEAMNWAGWDEMVKDFSTEIHQDQNGSRGLESGPLLESMTGWW